jgi:hypothetical protein
MRLYRFAWALWIAGSVVIGLSWIDAVSRRMGWGGWIIALCGTILSFIARQSCSAGPPARAPSTAVADLDRLVELRNRGDITEEQYLRQRNALLGEPDRDKPKAP